MVNSNIEYIYENFLNFTIPEMKSAIRTGLNRVANIILNNARENLRKDYKNVDQSVNFSEPLTKGIRKNKIKQDANGELYIKVRAHSNNKQGSGSYILPMLENGTAERYTKDGYYRGKIQGTQFFQRAVNTFDVDSILIEEIKKKVDSIKHANAR